MGTVGMHRSIRGEQGRCDTQTGVGVGDGRGTQASSTGSPPQCPWRQEPVLRKEASGATPAFAHHLVMALGFRAGPDFFHKHFHLWNSSPPSPRAGSSEPVVVPSRVCVPTRRVRHPALICTDGCVSQAGAHGLGHEPPLWVSFHAACPQGLSSVPTDLPAGEGASPDVGATAHPQ